jgi:clan AA aspartic protease (TIGR02281 family)
MKNKLVSAAIFLTLLFSLNAQAQSNSEEKIQDALYTLKEYVRDWSCDRYLKGSFIENLEISLIDGDLILKSNFSQSDADFFGFPEYTKAIIKLSTIRSVTIQETDKQCAGININTKVNGIQLINKYRNSNNEVPMPKESDFREKFGWKNDAIRLSNNYYFNERSNKVANIIKQIAILSGNTLLEEARSITNVESSNQNVIQMKSNGGVSVIPCKVNGLNLNFIFDTGASNVSISMTEATFMFKNGYLNKEDIIGSNNYRDANGNVNEGIIVNIREIEIGGIQLRNVKATIVKNNRAPLLLGQTAISKLGNIQLDLKSNTLIINGGNTPSKIIDYSENIPISFNPSQIIGKPVRLGKIEVTQYKFPTVMTWSEAQKACRDLKNGWRLPTKDELILLYNNKNKIGNFEDIGFWSSLEGKDDRGYDAAWGLYFLNGIGSFGYKNFESAVRAVRTFQ